MSVQKAFVPDIPGCTEHHFFLHEAFCDARTDQRSVCACWLDFKNAYGSVHHNLIHFAIKHYHGPAHFRIVVQDLYQSLSTNVLSENWSTSCFKYCVGVFHSDPLSFVIFSTVASLLCDVSNCPANDFHGTSLPRPMIEWCYFNLLMLLSSLDVVHDYASPM